MPKPKLRKFKESDLKAVLSVARSTGYFTKKDLKTIAEGAVKEHCVVAEVCSKIEGFVVFSSAGRKAKIEYIAVRWPKSQGLGLGSKLLKRAESRIKALKAKRVVLHTFGSSGNYRPFFKVREFYYKNGFQRLREIPNGFVNGVDKLIMFKEFS